MFKAPYRRREEQGARPTTNGRVAELPPPAPARGAPLPQSRPVRRPLRRGLRWSVGLSLACLSFGLNLLWAAAIRPLNAPDELAYLQTLMQVRNELTLPEIHFDFQANPQGTVIGAPG